MSVAEWEGHDAETRIHSGPAGPRGHAEDRGFEPLSDRAGR